MFKAALPAKYNCSRFSLEHRHDALHYLVLRLLVEQVEHPHDVDVRQCALEVIQTVHLVQVDLQGRGRGVLEGSGGGENIRGDEMDWRRVAVTEEIVSCCKELGEKIDSDYVGRSVSIICKLAHFAANLCRR